MRTELGQIKRGKETGKHLTNGSVKYVWHACVGCGGERWVALINNIPVSPRCRSCSVKERTEQIGKANIHWKGGRIKTKHGYIMVRIYPDDFFYSMVCANGYVAEHRLVVAKALGRCLHRWEVVHHKEGFARDDNRYPKTLQLVTDDRHKQITILENRIALLEGRIGRQDKRITLLEAEIVLLK